ncbi:hypothetical protein ACFOET_09815 [Parapedobacter deserti]|uniref:Uncharacterized protein n=1 Tax=Parapedobacter deserti TaxID=1912957 RepID=A0ABV7JM62_9SPHI
MTETIFGMEGRKGDVAAEQLSQAMPTAKPAASFSFYGQNRRNYLFLTRETQYEWMSVNAMDAFLKTLAALKLTSDDIALLNVGRLSVFPQEDDLFSFFKPKTVVSLGVALPWTELNNAAPVMDCKGVRLFRTYTFDEMLADADKKRQFWTTAKTILV